MSQLIKKRKQKQLCHQFKDISTPDFYDLFTLPCLLSRPERWCLFHLAARCSRASWQPQVTCVALLLSRWSHRCIRFTRFTGASTLPGASRPGGFFKQPAAQKPPSGSADFCDIRFECVSPFDCDVPTWLKVALFWELASLSRVSICLPVFIWKCYVNVSSVLCHCSWLLKVASQFTRLPQCADWAKPKRESCPKSGKYSKYSLIMFLMMRSTKSY